MMFLRNLCIQQKLLSSPAYGMASSVLIEEGKEVTVKDERYLVIMDFIAQLKKTDEMFFHQDGAICHTSCCDTLCS